MTLLKLIGALRDLARAIVMLSKVIRLRKPGLVFVKMISEQENGMSKFVFVLPAPSAADVVSREITYSLNGGEPVTQTVAGTALESDPFDANQGDVAAGTLIDIDDATPVANRSEPRTFEHELLDTIAPGQPGEVGVRMTEE